MSPSPQAQAIRAWTDRVTLGMIAFCVALEVFAVLGFLLRVPISAATVWLAGAASVAIVVASFRLREGWAWRSLVVVGVCAVLLVGSCVFAAHFYDVSYDGQAYQQSAVLRLAAGWNPLADVTGQTLTGPHTVWHESYPKGPWLEGAAMFKLIGRIEPAKGLTIFLGFAVLAFCFGVFASFKNMPLMLAGVFALLAALNPILILQAFTFYVDGRSTVWLTILIVALLDMALRADADPLVVAIAGFAAIAGLNIKFTSTVFVLLLLLVGGIIILMRVPRPQFRRAAAIMFAAALIGLLLVGWDPYVTNQVNHGSPFYPVSGRDAFAVLTPAVMPADFVHGSPLKHLYRSVFGVSADPYDSKSTQMKLPFTIRPLEWHQFDVADQRIGALGPLFGGALLLSLAIGLAVLALHGWRNSLIAVTIGIVGVLLLTVLINPEAWWVRYNPQLWLVPVLLSAMVFLLPENRAPKAAALLTCFVLVADVAFVGTASLKAQVNHTAHIRTELVDLSSRQQPVPIYFDLMGSNGERFREAGIRFRVLADKPADGYALYNSDTVVGRQ